MQKENLNLNLLDSIYNVKIVRLNILLDISTYKSNIVSLLFEVKIKLMYDLKNIDILYLAKLSSFKRQKFYFTIKKFVNSIKFVSM